MILTGFLKKFSRNTYRITNKINKTVNVIVNPIEKYNARMIVPRIPAK
jgi:hypothetical protein